jgi:hypothetical protein
MVIAIVAFAGITARMSHYKDELRKEKQNLQQLDNHHAEETKELEIRLQKTQEELDKAKTAKAKKERSRAALASLVGIKTANAAPKSVSNPKLYIYLKESGNNPTRYNSQGCVGLGQACPGSKLLAACPKLDYACEDAWFTRYAISRYGSWEGAYRFWVANHWW